MGHMDSSRVVKIFYWSYRLYKNGIQGGISFPQTNLTDMTYMTYLTNFSILTL